MPTHLVKYVSSLTDTDWARRHQHGSGETAPDWSPGISHQVTRPGSCGQYISWLIGHPGAKDTHHSNRGVCPVPLSQRINTVRGTTAQGATDRPSCIAIILTAVVHLALGCRMAGATRLLIGLTLLFKWPWAQIVVAASLSLNLRLASGPLASHITSHLMHRPPYTDCRLR